MPPKWRRASLPTPISLKSPRQKRGKDVKKEREKQKKTPSEVLPAKSITPALSTAHRRRRMKQTTTDAIARKRSVIRPSSSIKVDSVQL